MAGPTQPRSPRLSWAFGSNGPCEEVLGLLAKEHIDSGVLLADAFSSSLDGVEAFAAMRGCSVEATSQLALAWTANSVADLWAETGVRLSKLAVAPLQLSRFQVVTLTCLLQRLWRTTPWILC